MKKRNLNLSKSTLIRSLQCDKSLYLYKNYYRLRDKPSAELQARFNRGHTFGKLAWDLFPHGKDVSPPSPRAFMQSVNATQHLIDQQEPVIYEAAFRHDNVLVFLDILVRKNEKWYAYEVKSSRRISETYIRDAAIQNYVIQNSGLELTDFSIVHVREDFDPDQHLEAEDVFLKVSVWDTIESMKGFVADTIANAQSTLRQDEIPNIEMGEHCDIPYPCDFKGFCSRRTADVPT